MILCDCADGVILPPCLGDRRKDLPGVNLDGIIQVATLLRRVILLLVISHKDAHISNQPRQLLPLEDLKFPNRKCPLTTYVPNRRGFEIPDKLIDLRYRGQSHELTVPWNTTDDWAAALSRFHEMHLERNGFARPDDPIEVIAARAEATGPAAITLADLVVAPDGGDPRRGDIEIIEAGVPRSAELWWRPSASGEITGPAIIAEPSCTTFVASGERATVLENGALELEW